MKGETNLEVNEHNCEAAARSQVYKLLSGMFEFPDDERKKKFVRSGVISALREAVDRLPYRMPAVSSIDRFGDEPNLEQAYTRFFDNCTGRASVSLYEKDYSTIDAKTLWEELIRFYEYFGLEYDLGKCGEWPDHLGTELQFLHYLTFLEAGSPDQKIGSVVVAQRDFLERHLSKWVPKLAVKLMGLPDTAPYGPIVQVLVQFIDAEHEFSRTRKDVKEVASSSPSLPSSAVILP